ncbi:hypothetical protein ADUPG1_000490 [Aduncisulcus paluster]|uniref:Pre-mRNA-splicing factor 3 domain-containing protein n=1 Tax=Aduncisulcus paluster TaxID=2918883 RepID=A0ABQ5K6I1_9EUKA|nr:hypothetical protein ADUPG1_000490 [Aduncisulcus paluster]
MHIPPKEVDLFDFNFLMARKVPKQNEPLPISKEEEIRDEFSEKQIEEEYGEEEEEEEEEDNFFSERPIGPQSKTIPVQMSELTIIPKTQTIISKPTSPKVVPKPISMHIPPKEVDLFDFNFLMARKVPKQNEPLPISKEEEIRDEFSEKQIEEEYGEEEEEDEEEEIEGDIEEEKEEEIPLDESSTHVSHMEIYPNVDVYNIKRYLENQDGAGIGRHIMSIQNTSSAYAQLQRSQGYSVWNGELPMHSSALKVSISEDSSSSPALSFISPGSAALETSIQEASESGEHEISREQEDSSNPSSSNPISVRSQGSTRVRYEKFIRETVEIVEPWDRLLIPKQGPSDFIVSSFVNEIRIDDYPTTIYSRLNVESFQPVVFLTSKEKRKQRKKVSMEKSDERHLMTKAGVIKHEPKVKLSAIPRVLAAMNPLNPTDVSLELKPCFST